MKKHKSLNFLFILMFIILGLVSLQIPFTRLLGNNVKFTLFDFMAPVAGAFLGSYVGILAVLLTQLLNFLITGTALTQGAVIRLLPTLFAIIYFSQKHKSILLVPLLSIFLFNLHPIGRSAWQYSLFWLIPLVAYIFRKNLFLKSLGATFTAHAVGGAAWVWAFGLTREIWLALIPQVIMERLSMAIGISLSYIILSKLAFYFTKVKAFPKSYKKTRSFAA